MTNATMHVLERVALAWLVVCTAVVAVMAVAWGPNVLYFAAPFYLASVVIVGVRLWARKVGGLPTFTEDREGAWRREYWDGIEGRNSEQRD